MSNLGFRISLLRVAACTSLLSGCMGSLDDVLARHEVERQALATLTAHRVASGQPCCASYREMTFQPLRTGVEQEIVLAQSSPVFDFPFGKSRFEALSLPSMNVGDVLEVKAVELISGPSAKPIFRPDLVLLSETFEPLQLQPSLDFNDHFTGWSVEGHSARVIVSAAYVGARYAIVAADPAAIGKSYLKPAHTVVTPAVYAPDQHFPYGYEGQAFIELERSSR